MKTIIDPIFLENFQRFKSLKNIKKYFMHIIANQLIKPCTLYASNSSLHIMWSPFLFFDLTNLVFSSDSVLIFSSKFRLMDVNSIFFSRNRLFFSWEGFCFFSISFIFLSWKKQQKHKSFQIVIKFQIGEEIIRTKAIAFLRFQEIKSEMLSTGKIMKYSNRAQTIFYWCLVIQT